MVKNKKGITTFGTIIIIFVALMAIIMLAIFSYSIGIVDSNLSKINLTLGNTSFNQMYTSNMHPGMQTLQNNTPKIISIGLMIGMILCLLYVSTKTPPKSKLWIIIDILIIILAEVFAVIISLGFQNYIISINSDLMNIYINTLSEGSKFIIYLPAIIPTIGALVMIATYILRRERSEDLEEQQAALEGLYRIE
jgi:hypothetical protein